MHIQAVQSQIFLLYINTCMLAQRKDLKKSLDFYVYVRTHML